MEDNKVFTVSVYEGCCMECCCMGMVVVHMLVVEFGRVVEFAA